MDDLISRQAAIKVCEHHKTEGLPCKNAAISMCIDSIEALPSAQPEIIRCKDCKYYEKVNHGGVCGAWDAKAVNENDYCSDAERRNDD